MQLFLFRRILPLVLLGTLALGSCVRREGPSRGHHERGGRPGPPPGPGRGPGY